MLTQRKQCFAFIVVNAGSILLTWIEIILNLLCVKKCLDYAQSCAKVFDYIYIYLWKGLTANFLNRLNFSMLCSIYGNLLFKARENYSNTDLTMGSYF